MPEYDAFGRPIYETAEEYNRAHKTSGSAHLHTSTGENTYKKKAVKGMYRTQGQVVSPSNVKKAKPPLVTKLGIIVICFLVGFFVAVNMARMSVDEIDEIYEFYEEEQVDMDPAVPDSYGEYLGEDTTPLTEGFEIFFYNGQVYSLPTTVEEIDKMGFVLEDAYDENDMFPTDYEEALILNGEDGFYAGIIQVCNYTGEELPLQECQVTFFSIENPAAYDEASTVPDFVFGDGLTFESSYEEVEAYLGVPYYHYGEHSQEGGFYDNYQWEYYGEDEIHVVSITFWNGVMADIGIEKRVIE